MSKSKRRPGIFDDIPKVKIERDPPKPIENGDGIIDYHAVIDELEKIYTEKVRSSGSDREALEATLGYDENVERLTGRLAEIYTAGGLDDGSLGGVGGKIAKHQKMLREAAFAEQERVAHAKAEKAKLKQDMERGY